IHGGPQGMWDDRLHSRWNAQLFAAPGFMTLLPNPRGSIGYGQKFLDEVSRDWGGKAYEDLMKGVDFVIEKGWVDPERMAQVLGNLVSNALRHTPAGGRITLGAASHGDEVWLTVRDTGEGIAPEDLPRVFDRFYRGDEARQVHKARQVHEARQVRESESGLGLAIAKSIVELHGGTIAVKSALGEGTTFTIVLPAGAVAWP
ncbi:MAG: prolyl oligopeptidase family serine peptidase, partial [Chloroflexi bacterium]|nr:prolyl oligopeptidase family serine peptidase [Chloroflexota bacterium]